MMSCTQPPNNIFMQSLWFVCFFASSACLYMKGITLIHLRLGILKCVRPYGAKRPILYTRSEMPSTLKMSHCVGVLHVK